VPSFSQKARMSGNVISGFCVTRSPVSGSKKGPQPSKVEKLSCIQPMACPASLYGIIRTKKVRLDSNSIKLVELVVKFVLFRISAVKGDKPMVTRYPMASGTSAHSSKGLRETLVSPSAGLTMEVQPGKEAAMLVVNCWGGQSSAGPILFLGVTVTKICVSAGRSGSGLKLKVLPTLPEKISTPPGLVPMLRS